LQSKIFRIPKQRTCCLPASFISLPRCSRQFQTSEKTLKLPWMLKLNVVCSRSPLFHKATPMVAARLVQTMAPLAITRFHKMLAPLANTHFQTMVPSIITRFHRARPRSVLVHRPTGIHTICPICARGCCSHHHFDFPVFFFARDSNPSRGLQPRPTFVLQGTPTPTKQPH